MMGADVASDHHLVVANIKLKLRKSSTHVIVKRKYDVGKLQDPKIQQEFKLEIKNRFQLLENISTEDTDTIPVDFISLQLVSYPFVLFCMTIKYV